VIFNGKGKQYFYKQFSRELNMFEVFLICLALIWIVFASGQDLKSREVANWLNFSLIIFALGFRFFYSLFNLNKFEISSLSFSHFFDALKSFVPSDLIFFETSLLAKSLLSFIMDFFIYLHLWLSNVPFLQQGLYGLGIFFVLGNIFYYGRIFAGGDAKLLIALGAVLPFSLDFWINVRIFGLFIFALLLVGGFYGIIWSFVLSIKNFKDFKKEFLIQMKANKMILYSGFILGGFLLILSFVEGILFYFGVLLFAFSYLYVYAKSIDECCMVKKIKVKDLREGDWLYEDVKVGKKILKKNWEGLGKEEIELISKNYKEVKIKQGIPFVPVFLISFLLLVLFYKWSLLWFNFF